MYKNHLSPIDSDGKWVFKIKKHALETVDRENTHNLKKNKYKNEYTLTNLRNKRRPTPWFKQLTMTGVMIEYALEIDQAFLSMDRKQKKQRRRKELGQKAKAVDGDVHDR